MDRPKFARGVATIALGLAGLTAAVVAMILAVGPPDATDSPRARPREAAGPAWTTVLPATEPNSVIARLREIRVKAQLLAPEGTLTGLPGAPGTHAELDELLAALIHDLQRTATEGR